MTPKRYADARVVVIKQGGPIVNGGYIIAAGDGVVAIDIDMKSKRCDVFAESQSEDGAPVIWIAGWNALHLMAGRELQHTEVTFPDFKGWSIFSCHISRYTLRVCLVKDQC